MTERQFILDKLKKDNAILSVQITDNISNDNYFIMTKEAYEDDIDEIVDLLNELSDENRQLQKEIKRLEKMIWKIQWRFQQEVGIEKAREHYQEIDKEMED